MSEFIEAAIWWTGASVLCAGATLAAALLFSGLVICATALANYYGRRAWNVQDNLQHMYTWRQAGMPMWKNTATDGGCRLEMVPTGPVAEDMGAN